MKKTFYKPLWETTNLKKDYWSIIGFSSEEHFKNAAKHKLILLQNIGFNFNSNLLDVGCGSGTIPSAIFNDMKGKYYGCDIGENAIEFCREKYNKNNFTFFVSQQTDVIIPDANIDFDFICFYSLFTHCYEDEIIILLNQCKEYLKNDGKILADFFIGTHDGDNRVMSGLSQKIFNNILIQTGLKCSVISDTYFQDGIQRILVTLSV